MNLFTKSTLAVATIALSSVALADPIEGNWKQYSDNGKLETMVKISKSGNSFTGKIVKAYSKDAKKFVGATIIRNLKAKGKNKYAGGKITDPSSKKSYRLTAKVNGKKLQLRGYLGPFYRTQNWKK